MDYHTLRNHKSGLWSVGRPEWSVPAQVEDPYFDKALNAWVLSRHRDVLAAFQCPLLVPVGPRSKFNPGKLNDDTKRLTMRAETSEALSSVVLRDWKDQISRIARTILDAASIDKPLDLVNEYARPVSEALASIVTGIAPSEARNLIPLAQELSAAAAEPFDEQLATRAKAADAELRKHFHSGPVSLRESGFVALSQTLCRMLTNIWAALIEQPEVWQRLNCEPTLTPRAIEELLRYAGFTRILFRMGIQTVDLDGMSVREGNRIILRLAAANRDPAQFQDPEHMHIMRRSITHFSFGSGPHSCVGAPLIRMALSTFTHLLVERYSKASLCDVFEWGGGSGFLFPTSLPVLLQA
jgi:cytochrome P450